MADRFFDTSAVAKHYRNEFGTATVDAFLAEPGSRHFISSLCIVNSIRYLPVWCGPALSPLPISTRREADSLPTLRRECGRSFH